MVNDLVERVEAADLSALDRAGLEAVAADLGRLAGWVEARRMAVARRLREVTPLAAIVLGDASRSGAREADRVMRRVDAVTSVPGFEAALAQGRVSAGHVDVLSSGVARLAPENRGKLAGAAGRLLAVAEHATPEQFAATVRRVVNGLVSDDGMARLARQRAATTLRHWVDRETGMVCLHAEFDPERGIELIGRLDREVEARFHDALPEGCPEDDRKHGHLRALALLAFSEGKGRVSGRPAVLLVTDERTLAEGWHERSILDVGSEADVPLEVVRRWADEGQRIPVTMVDGVVTAVDGCSDLDHGRTRRLASWRQRLALRAMYPTCAVPGCGVPFSGCDIHHVQPWEEGGNTDLGELLPVCWRHHDAVHRGGWRLRLDPVTRLLTITKPDGSVMTHPPPYCGRP